MAENESIGAVSVQITGDYSQLTQAFGQAQSVAQQAGVKVAAAFTQGAGTVAGAQERVKQATQNLANAQQQLAAFVVAGNKEAIAAVGGYQAELAAATAQLHAATAAEAELAASQKDVAAAAERAILALGGEAAATENLARANSHAVTEIQATSGALRALEGNGGIRAAERFIVTTLQLGQSAQAIFPIVGAGVLLGIVIKLGEEAYHAAQNFLYLKDAEEAAMKVGAELGKEAEVSLARLTSMQADALDKQGKHLEAAQVRQRALISQPIQLPDLLNNKEVKDALDTFQNKKGWEDLKNLLTQVIPADIPARVEAITAAMQRANAEIQSVDKNRGAGFTDPLSAHYYAQDKVEVELYAQALEFLKTKQAELAQQTGLAGTEGFQKQQAEAGALAARNIENEISANKRLFDLKKQTAETVIEQQRIEAEIAIKTNRDPHRELETQALANLEVATAKEKARLLGQIAKDEADYEIAQINRKAAAEKLGKTPTEQAQISASARGEVSTVQDTAAAANLTLHYGVEAAQARAGLSAANDTLKAQNEIDAAIRKGFDELQTGWKEATLRVREYEDRVVEANRRVAEIQAKSTGDVQALQIEGEKLSIERAYALAVGHTGQEKIRFAQDVARTESTARAARIAGLEQEKAQIPEDSDKPELGVRRAQIEAQIADLRAKANNADYQAQTRILQLIQQQSVLHTAQAAIFHGVTQAGPAAVGNALAGAAFGGQKGQSVGTEVANALKNVGKQILGEIFTAAIEKMVAELIANTAINAALGTIFGSTGAAQVTATTAQTVATAALTAAMLANTAAQGVSAGASVAGGVASAAGGVAGAASSAAGAAASGLVGPLIAAAGGIIGGVISAAATWIGDNKIVKAVNATTAAVLSLKKSGFDNTNALNGKDGAAGNQNSVATTTTSVTNEISKIPFVAGILGGFGLGNGTPVRLVGIDPGVLAGFAFASSIAGSVLGLLGFAEGGTPQIGVPALGGEVGPELAVPHNGGPIRVIGANGPQIFTPKERISIIPNHLIEKYVGTSATSLVASKSAVSSTSSVIMGSASLPELPAYAEGAGLEALKRLLGAVPPDGSTAGQSTVNEFIASIAPQLVSKDSAIAPRGLSGASTSSAFVPRSAGPLIPDQLKGGYAPGPGGDAQGSSFDYSSSVNRGGDTFHFALHGVQNGNQVVDHVMRKLPVELKRRSNVFAPYGK